MSVRPLIALLLVAALASAALLVVALSGRPEPAVIAEEDASPFRGGSLPDEIDRRAAPSFRLRDARGGFVDTDRLKGTPYVVTFLFTDCPDVCPLIGAELGQALRRLGPDAGNVSVVAVSVDPEGDTPEAVRRWLRRLRLPQNFHYAIGSERELAPVWEAHFAAPQERGAKESRHSASIWLIDAEGRWRTKFSAGAPVAPADLEHDLRLLLAEQRG